VQLEFNCKQMYYILYEEKIFVFIKLAAAIIITASFASFCFFKKFGIQNPDSK